MSLQALRAASAGASFLRMLDVVLFVPIPREWAEAEAVRAVSEVA
jgi:hypothetical protein